MESKRKVKKRKIEDDSEDDELSEEIKPTKKKRKHKKSSSRKKSKSKSESNSKSKDKTENKPSYSSTKQSLLEDFKFELTNKKIIEYPLLPPKSTISLITWNINGFRPLLKSNEFDKLINDHSPDFICFNELKIDNDLSHKNKYNKLYENDYKSYWYCPAEKKGYSGVAIFTKYAPLSVQYGINKSQHDNEGRVITLEYDEFYLVACYTPNAGDKLKRLDYRVDEWDTDFFEFMKNLKIKKSVILCGDLNVAFDDIDIYDTKGHSKTPGFTNEERESFGKFLEMGFVDTFRELHKEEIKFSYFTKRVKTFKKDNKGWRLDYFIVNDSVDNKKFKVLKSDMLDKEEYDSSDHIPIILEIKFK